MYNPATGIQALSSGMRRQNFRPFVEDTWQVSRNLTLTLGLRYDDSGNPWSKSAATVFGNFYFGTGTTSRSKLPTDTQKRRLTRCSMPSTTVESARRSAWDPTGKGDSAVREALEFTTIG